MQQPVLPRGVACQKHANALGAALAICDLPGVSIIL